MGEAVTGGKGVDPGFTEFLELGPALGQKFFAYVCPPARSARIFFTWARKTLGLKGFCI